MKFGLQRVSIWVNIQKKISSSSVAQYRKKSAMLISSYHRIFLEKCATEEHEILVCNEYPYALIYKKNFKFLGRTV